MSETVVCVGALVRRADSVLLVRQSPGHSLEGQWTIPWGRLSDGESPSAAVLREIGEESAITARIEGLLGFQELPAPWVGMHRAPTLDAFPSDTAQCRDPKRRSSEAGQ